MTDQRTPTSEPSRAMDLARDEALAAYAVAIDPNCNPALAVPHLVEGWRWFYLAVEREPPPTDVPTLAVWVRKQSMRSVGEARAERAGDFVDKHAPRSELRVPLPLKEADLLDQLAVLRDRVDAERRRLGELPPAYSRRGLWARRIGAWGGIGIAAFMIALRPWQWEGIGSWRGAYYPGYELRGDPDVRREVDVDFDWGILPPTDSIQSDRFGARFDTCLVLEEDTEATFQLIADDGARLTIDDEMVLDFLEPAGVPPTVMGMEWELEAGVHHVKVEYREDDEEAQVHLLATFDPDVPPEPLPARMLEYPGDEIDDDDPCGHVAP